MGNPKYNIVPGAGGDFDWTGVLREVPRGDEGQWTGKGWQLMIYGAMRVCGAVWRVSRTRYLPFSLLPKLRDNDEGR